MTKCMCIGPACARETRYGILSEYCLDCPVRFKARMVVGSLPEALDPDDTVIVLYNREGRRRIILRMGGWSLEIPTRLRWTPTPLLAAFTLSSFRGMPTIVTGTIFEAYEASLAAVEAMRELYPRVEAIPLDLAGDVIETEAYTLRVAEDQAVFEVKT